MLISHIPPEIGAIVPYGGSGSAIPRGYELTLGQALNIADYPELFAVIGFSYGVAPPGTFLLPREVNPHYNPFLIYAGRSVPATS